MAKKRKRAAAPLMLFWSRRDQRRFIDAVERLSALVGDFAFMAQDLKTLLSTRGRRKPADRSANVTENGDPSTPTTERT